MRHIVFYLLTILKILLSRKDFENVKYKSPMTKKFEFINNFLVLLLLLKILLNLGNHNYLSLAWLNIWQEKLQH